MDESRATKLQQSPRAGAINGRHFHPAGHDPFCYSAPVFLYTTSSSHCALLTSKNFILRYRGTLETSGISAEQRPRRSQFLTDIWSSFFWCPAPPYRLPPPSIHRTQRDTALDPPPLLQSPLFFDRSSFFDSCLPVCCSSRTDSKPPSNPDTVPPSLQVPPHDKQIIKMASAIKSALPSRLKPGDNKDGEEQPERHHGKTRSHMAS